MTEMTNVELNELVLLMNARIHSPEPLTEHEAMVIACDALTHVGNTAKARRRLLEAGTLLRNNVSDTVTIDAKVWDEIYNFLLVVGGADDGQRPH